MDIVLLMVLASGIQLVVNIVVVCIDLSGKEPHRQGDTVRVVTSVSLGRVMARNARDLGLVSALGAIFPIFITPNNTCTMTMILYKLCIVWSLNLPCVCIYNVTVGMHAIGRKDCFV